MWNLISIYLETVLVSMQDRCTIYTNVPQARKSFWMHTMELLGDVVNVESYFIPFGDTNNLDAR
jgi:hypothetical protein